MNYLLSIVIPGFRKENLKKLLENIYLNISLDKDEYEVIVSDDNEKEPLGETAISFEKKMNIIYTKNHKIHCPSNNRQNGFEKASGKWVTFIDDDDTITPNAFETLKEIFKKDDIAVIETHHLTYSDEDGLQDFGAYDFKGSLYNPKYTERCLFKALTHGKIYNMKFLKENNIHYLNRDKTKILSEDVYFQWFVVSKVIESRGVWKRFANRSKKYSFYIFYKNANSLSRAGFFNKEILSAGCTYVLCFSKPLAIAKKYKKSDPEISHKIYRYIETNFFFSLIYPYFYLKITKQITPVLEKKMKDVLRRMKESFLEDDYNEKRRMELLNKFLTENEKLAKHLSEANVLDKFIELMKKGE